jgi:hypothetical protein
MKEIELQRGLVALVDDEDFKYLNQFKWNWVEGYNTFYCVRNITKEDGRKTQIRMHNVIMKTQKGMEVDHINHDGLDNRKYNLRNCTHQENCMNRLSERKPKSGFKGVYPIKGGNPHHWSAQISVNGKKERIGSFKTKEEAALEYNRRAIKLHGKFAKLNLVNGEYW